MVTTPLAPHVGVEVTGVSGRELVDPARAEECRAALDRHGVVVYREADPSDDELVGFSRLLGEVVPNPTGEHEHPEIATITLDPARTNAVLAWYRQGNFLWHIDGATDALPQRATLLVAREVDEAGGDTEFATTYAARVQDLGRVRIVVR
jgi:alpha-ketoglutarate-dependent taurine dioxygenase